VRRKKRIFISLLIFFSSFCGHWCSAQESDAVGDSLIRKKHNPRTAVICSALLPGLGQIYNGKYWKVPLVYGAGGAAVYAFQYNQAKYKKYREAYDEGDENKTYIIDGYKRSYAQLPLGRDYYRRYRDISVLCIAGVYLLNIVDAMVDAYFKEFDVSDDLTLRIQPAVVDNFDLAASFGLKISFGF
jgi:TM2 domain-containing membrane protein YozV